MASSPSRAARSAGSSAITKTSSKNVPTGCDQPARRRGEVEQVGASRAPREPADRLVQGDLGRLLQQRRVVAGRRAGRDDPAGPLASPRPPRGSPGRSTSLASWASSRSATDGRVGVRQHRADPVDRVALLGELLLEALGEELRGGGQHLRGHRHRLHARRAGQARRSASARPARVGAVHGEQAQHGPAHRERVAAAGRQPDRGGQAGHQVEAVGQRQQRAGQRGRQVVAGLAGQFGLVDGLRDARGSPACRA